MSYNEKSNEVRQNKMELQFYNRFDVCKTQRLDVEFFEKNL